jgi:phosphonate transport system ATP-binding protein
MLLVQQLTLAAAAGAPPLLRRASLALARGEALAITGQSGAGKTTLLRAIAGELAPREGRILLHGKPTAALVGRERAAIGLVAQAHDLVAPLRADRNVLAGALGRWSAGRALRVFLRPNSEEEAIAEEALSAVGLSGAGRRRSASLSGGERQRVAIARALVQGPELLLADEPVASLDPVAAHQTLDLLTSLARERRMGLICTLHQPELAARHFDRVLRLTDAGLVP